MKSVTFKAWAIDTNSKEGHGFIGRYWNFGNTYQPLPVHLEGCREALFVTRKLALENLPSVRRYSFPKARVVRVAVTIKTI